MYARRSPTSHGPHGVQYASSARGSAETRQRPPQAPQAPPQPSAQARLRLVIRKAAPQQARHAARAMPRSPPESEHPARSASRARAPLGSMRSTAARSRGGPLYDFSPLAAPPPSMSVPSAVISSAVGSSAPATAPPAPWSALKARSRPSFLFAALTSSASYLIRERRAPW